MADAGGLAALVDADWCAPALDAVLPGLTPTPFLDEGVPAAPDSDVARAAGATLMADIQAEALRGAGRARAAGLMGEPAEPPLPLAGPAVGGTAAAALRHPGLQSLWLRAGGAHADRLPWAALWAARFEAIPPTLSAEPDADADAAAARVAVQALALSEEARAAVVSAVGGSRAAAAATPAGPTCAVVELDDVVGPALGGLASAEACPAVALAALQGGLVPPSIAAEAAGHLPHLPEVTIGLEDRAAALADGLCAGGRLVWVVGPAGLGKATATAAAARLLLDRGAWSAVRWMPRINTVPAVATSPAGGTAIISVPSEDALGSALMHAWGGSPAPGVADLARALARVAAVGGPHPALILRLSGPGPPAASLLTVLDRLQDLAGLKTVVLWSGSPAAGTALPGTTLSIPRLIAGEVEALLAALAPAAPGGSGTGDPAAGGAVPAYQAMLAGLPRRVRLAGACLDRPWLMGGGAGLVADRGQLPADESALAAAAMQSFVGAAPGGGDDASVQALLAEIAAAFIARVRARPGPASDPGEGEAAALPAAFGAVSHLPPPQAAGLRRVLLEAGLDSYTCGRSGLDLCFGPRSARDGDPAEAVVDCLVARSVAGRLAAAESTAAAGAAAAAARAAASHSHALLNLTRAFMSLPKDGWCAARLDAAAGLVWDGGALLPPVLGAATHARVCNAVATAAAEVEGAKDALARALWAGGAALARRGEWSTAATVLAGAREAIVEAGRAGGGASGGPPDQAPPPAHPDASRILASLAQATYKATGDIKAAQDLYAAAYASRPAARWRGGGGVYPSRRRLFSRADEDLADTLADGDDGDLLDGAAGLLRVAGAERDAEAVYRAALDVRSRTRGPTHPAALAAANNLAVLLGSAAAVRAGAGGPGLALVEE